MNIRNNLLAYLKNEYLQALIDFYDSREAEQLLTILIDHFFEVSRNKLILNPDLRLSESEILKLHLAVKELKKYKPVQYITGVVEFHELKLDVTPNVLIPRPETEELVQLIVAKETGDNLNILDIGTGSGCIAISLSKFLIDSNVYASDISENAIKLAKKNSLLNNQVVNFFVHDILHNNGPMLSKNGNHLFFDIIVSNPPYVTMEDKNKMHVNVVDYEPHSALFVPEDNPLVYYEAILNFAEKHLKSGGRIYFEINESLGSEMLILIQNNNYSNVVIQKDLREKDRFISAVKL